MDINKKSTGGYTGKEIARYALDYFFPIVDIEGISVTSEIFNHEPESQNQLTVRNCLLDIIREKSVRNFRAMAMLPSCDETQILFGRGLMPRVHRLHLPYNNDLRSIESSVIFYLYEYGSDIGNEKQWYAFLGQLILEFYIRFSLNNEGFSSEQIVSKAWSVVCDDTREYANIGTRIPEACGRKVLENFRWYDLGNKERIICNRDTKKYKAVGASIYSYGSTLAIGKSPDMLDISKIEEDEWNITNVSSNPVPWIVLNAPILK